MRNTAASRSALAAALLVASACAGCGAAGGTADAPTDAAGYTGTQMVDHLGRQLETLGQKMIDLADAMPDDRWDWSPMEGVRSVGQIYAHVAADNYFVPALVGMPVEGTGVTTDGATVGAYEAARGTPDEIRAGLEASFAAMTEAFAATRTDLGREIMLRENAITTGDLWVRAITHLHEHLGQAIAYARANEVVPPWSR